MKKLPVSMWLVYIIQYASEPSVSGLLDQVGFRRPFALR
jgi:hypothetical protein